MKVMYLLLIFCITTYSSVATKFVENKGQWNDDIKFVYHDGSFNMIIKADGVYYDLFDIKENSIEGNVIRQSFDNSNIIYSSLEENTERINIYRGSDSEKWIKEIKTYKSLKLENVFEDIDMRIYFDNNRPRYDYVVKEHANVEDIEIKYEGINSVEVFEKNFILKSDIANLDNTNLFVYQIVDNKRVEISAKFVQRDDVIKVEVGEYDRSKELIIDPVVFSSFAGGSGDDEYNNITLLDENHFVAIGTTNSTDLHTEVGAYSGTFNGEKDVFVQEYKMNGVYVDILYTTYIGGSGEDLGVDIDVTNDDEIIITGNTNSTDFPLMSAMQNMNNGGYDMFFTKFNSDYTDIYYSSYFGGSEDEFVRDMAMSNDDVSYYTGVTHSKDFPNSQQAFQKSSNGGSDGFIVGIKKSGLTSLFATYCGGNAEDELNSITLDVQSNIYVAGSSRSSDYPLEPSGFGDKPYDQTHNGGWDMVFTKLSSQGAKLMLSTFYGGSSDDFGRGIIVDNNSFEYWFIGESMKETGTPTIDISETADDATHNGGYDLVYGKFTDLEKMGWWERQRLIFASFFGGKNDDAVKSFVENPLTGNLTVIGNSNSKDLIVKGNNTITYKSKNDYYIAELAKSGGVEFMSYFGSKAEDIMNGSILDEHGNVYYVGQSDDEDNYYFSDNALDTSLEGEFDATIGKLTFGVLTIGTLPSKVCMNSTYNITWDKRDFDDVDGLTVELLDADNMPTVLAEGVKEDKWQWKISEEMEASANNKIRIFHKNGLYSVTQSEFEIVGTPEIDSVVSDIDEEVICEGQTVSLEVFSDDENEDYIYSWYKDDVVLADEKSTILLLENVMFEDSGDYYSSVQGFCNPATNSEKITIDVAKNTNITDQTTSSTFKEDKPMTLSVIAEGSINNYIWYKNDELIEGENDFQYQVDNLMLTDEGAYKCVVQGSCGEDQESQVMNITVVPNKSVLANNQSETSIFNFHYLNGGLRFSTLTKRQSIYQLKLIDNLGNVVYSDIEFELKQGVRVHNLSGLNLNNGLYILNLTDGQKSISSKVLISN